MASEFVEPVVEEKWSLLAKRVPESSVSSVVSSYTDQLVSAAMVIEMSAARAEWVSAPTLMKSTPASA